MHWLKQRNSSCSNNNSTISRCRCRRRCCSNNHSIVVLRVIVEPSSSSTTSTVVLRNNNKKKRQRSVWWSQHYHQDSSSNNNNHHHHQYHPEVTATTTTTSTCLIDEMYTGDCTAKHNNNNNCQPEATLVQQQRVVVPNQFHILYKFYLLRLVSLLVAVTVMTNCCYSGSSSSSSSIYRYQKQHHRFPIAIAVVDAWTTTTIPRPTNRWKQTKMRIMTRSHINYRTTAFQTRWESMYPLQRQPLPLYMSLDSRELRFFGSSSSSSITNQYDTSESSSLSRRTTTTTDMDDVYNDPTNNRHSYHRNSIIVPSYISHLFPTTVLEAQYKMMETRISPVIATAMSAVASAIMTTNLTPTTINTAASTTTTEKRPIGSEGSKPISETMNGAPQQATQLERRGKSSNDKSKLDLKMKRMVSTTTSSSLLSSPTSVQPIRQRPPQSGYGPSIQLTPEEQELFNLLRHVRNEIGLTTTLRVAGGWVRDKLLATPEFQTYHKVFTVGSQQQSQSVLDPSKRQPQQQQRISSKFRRNRNIFNNLHNINNPSSGRQGTKVLIGNKGKNGGVVDNAFQPVDIDIALDDMLGREFADHLNEYLSKHGQDTVTVGMVLKNPDKSKHLETATMKVNTFWIDFVNLRAEEYTQDSRIPDLMRIGTPHEDAYRRDLTINSLFYNINTGQVEDWTGRGFQDLRKGVVATPLHPLTTLLDDPLRVLRSIRFAARLRFTMDDELVKAAQMSSVADALSQKVSRERVGGELDLMLRSPDPVGAIRLLINLKQVQCVFPVAEYYHDIIVQQLKRKDISSEQMNLAIAHAMGNVFRAGLLLLSTAHDHLADCLWSPPVWCVHQKRIHGATEVRLVDDEDGRRLLWYAAFLKPIYDEFKRIALNTDIISAAATKTSKRNSVKNRSIVMKLLVDELKRPIRDSESIERIIKTADEFTNLIESGMDVSATMILVSDVSVTYPTTLSVTDNSSTDTDDHNVVTSGGGRVVCTMNGRHIDSNTEDDPVWAHAMEFRVSCAKALLHIGSLWRASLFLAISEELVRVEQQSNGGMEYTIEGDILHETQEEVRQGVMERFDTFAVALQQIGLIGIWDEKPIADGDTILKQILPGLPKGPLFRDVMDEQWKWMIQHPGADIDALTTHLQKVFALYVLPPLPEKSN